MLSGFRAPVDERGALSYLESDEAENVRACTDHHLRSRTGMKSLENARSFCASEACLAKE